MCSQGRTSTLSRNHDVPPGKETTIHWTTYRFQEEDATDGTSCAPSGPCKNTRQFPSSKTEHSTMNEGTVSAPTRPKRGRPYQKTIPIVFASRTLQIGDNQGPKVDDIGNNVNKMWHTQVVGQDGFFQSGTRGHPITRLITFQPIHNEVGHCEPVQTPEHTGGCPLQAPSKQSKIENWVSDDTHCPDIHKRLQQRRSSHR